ncbi:MAG: cobalamin-dependent protein [Sedimentisphaerales bacterium]|nr:cobalamin-dependent protein [Sedimentisphaerales bacterium]
MAKKIDLLLINPGGKKEAYGDLRFSLAAIEPPIWAGLIAAFVRERGFSVAIIDTEAEMYSDERIIEVIAECRPVLVAVGAVGSNPSASSTPKMVASGRLLNLIKSEFPKLMTALYGIHPSALPERTLTEERADFVFKGECFYTVVELLERLKSDGRQSNYNIQGLSYRKNGRVISNGWGHLVENIDELPFTAWDMLPMKEYRAHNWHCFGHLDQRQPYAVLYTSFGCPFSCTFCNINANYNGKSGVRFRNPTRIVDEIGMLVAEYGVRNIKFADEIFGLRESHIVQTCDLITERGYNLNIWAYTRIDTINQRLLEKMKAAGINWLAFGIESGSKKVRDGVVKGRFDRNAITKAIDMTHEAGIYIVANFIFGLPDDDAETMQETLDMAKELNCEYTNFYTAMAYPGSQLYEEMVAQQADLPDNWLGYSQFSREALPLSNKQLSSSEILRFRDKAFEEYHDSQPYLDMIERKFGIATVEHIKQMLEHKLVRNLA